MPANLRDVSDSLRIAPNHLEQIRGLAERAYPHECCGILIGPEGTPDKAVEQILPARNQNTDSPANRYLITADFIHEVEKELRGSGRRIVGFFHSHPDAPARPSQFDREHAWPWYSYLIVSVRKGSSGDALSWRLKEDRSGFDPETVEEIGGRLG